MKKVNVAVIGTGHLGRLHALYFANSRDVNLVGVCDIHRERAEAVSRESGANACCNHRDLLDKVEAVTIAVPTTSHHRIARDFLKAGVHTLVEKPMTSTLREADELIRLAGKKKLILQVGHVERFNPAIQSLYKLANNPQFIECHRLGPFKGRGIEVGVVLDLMIHDLDIVLGLVNSRLKRVDAVGVMVITRHEDIANARLTFENGTVCNLTASRLTQEAMRKIRVFQPDAYISIDYLKKAGSVYRKVKKEIVAEQLKFIDSHPLNLELASFIDCVRHGRRPLVSGKEGREALNVALEIVKKFRCR
jgi:predicted dehydrogenase